MIPFRPVEAVCLLFILGCAAHGDWNHDESHRISEAMAPDVFYGEPLPEPVALEAAPPLATLPVKHDVRYELKPRKPPSRARKKAAATAQNQKGPLTLRTRGY
jgi:hypothetical protein